MKRLFLFLAIALCEFSVAHNLVACTPQGKGQQTTVQVEENEHLPNGAIPFVLDGHLYLKATLNDSLPVSLVYDTGADHLYLDKDFLTINKLLKAFEKTAKMNMSGAGNSAPIQVDVITQPINIRMGKHTKQSKIAPIIKLRDILGCHADGLLGNQGFYSKPLYVSFSNNYLLPLDNIPASMLEGYTKLKAKYKNNRIYIKSKLVFDNKNVVKGLFMLDMGSGSGLILTQHTYASLRLSNKPQVHYHTQAGGIGGSQDLIAMRANHLTIADTLENPVVFCSQNTQGALSKRDYLGLIGTKILSLYDIIFDPGHQAIYFKKISEDNKYAKASTTQMDFINRTDICDGWVVNGLYKEGIAEKAGIEIGDIILSINGKPTKEITWEEERAMELKGRTTFVVRKADGNQKTFVLDIDKEII